MTNQIFLGDCLDLLSRMDDSSVDLVVTSPPYNLGKEYEGKVKLDRYISTQAGVIEQCVRVLKSTGSIFWQVGSFSDKGVLIPLDIRFFPVFESFNMIPRNRIAWIRQHGLHGRNKFSPRYETVLWFTKSDNYKFNLDDVRVPQKYKNKKYHTGSKKGKLSCNPDGKNPGDIWAFRNVKHNHEEQTLHPCQFPEDMVARMILSTTDEGDLVFDPYMGAGTVAVVSQNLNRKYMGAEMRDDYFNIATRRLDGKPDANGCFPNLKTLRDYAESNDQDVSQFSFDVQRGKKPTDRTKAKIHPESHHLDELYKRTQYEEEAFSAALDGREAPEDYFKGGKVRQTEPNLFDPAS